MGLLTLSLAVCQVILKKHLKSGGFGEQQEQTIINLHQEQSEQKQITEERFRPISSDVSQVTLHASFAHNKLQHVCTDASSSTISTLGLTVKLVPISYANHIGLIIRLVLIKIFLID